MNSLRARMGVAPYREDWVRCHNHSNSAERCSALLGLGRLEGRGAAPRGARATGGAAETGPSGSVAS